MKEFAAGYCAEVLTLPRPGLKHEVHNEPGNAAFTQEIGEWMLKHPHGESA